MFSWSSLSFHQNTLVISVGTGSLTNNLKCSEILFMISLCASNLLMLIIIRVTFLIIDLLPEKSDFLYIKKINNLLDLGKYYWILIKGKQKSHCSLLWETAFCWYANWNLVAKVLSFPHSQKSIELDLFPLPTMQPNFRLRF